MIKMDILEEIEKTLKAINKESINSKAIAVYIMDLIKNKVNKYLLSSYTSQVNTIAKAFKYNIALDSTDFQIIQNTIDSKLLWQSYSNLEESVSKEINEIILSNYEGLKLNTTEAKKEILDFIPKLTESRANTILRTENTNIKSLAQENTYNKLDPSGEFRYKWVGPDDYRTAESSKRVKMRTSRGVSMEELKQIIKEEADPRTYTPERPFLVHINQRHTYVKV